MKTHSLFLQLSVAISMIVLSACGGGDGGDDAPPAATPPFSQADLAGTWNFSILQAGPSITAGQLGWMRGWASVDGHGNVVITSLDTNLGQFPPSVLPWGIVWTIDPATGVISESSLPGSIFANPDFHAKLAPNKNLVIGTATDQNTSVPHPVQFRVMQKLASGVTYTLSDIANRSFMVHQVESGGGNDWMFASGSTNTAGDVFIPLFSYPTGTGAGGTIGTLAVHSGTGIVTMTTNTWFLGMMAPDKSFIIGTETSAIDSTVFRLTVIQMTDPALTYTQADLGATWTIHGILGAGAWIHGAATIDAAGNGSFLSWGDSMGGTVPPGSFTTYLASNGVVSDPTDTTLHGFLAPAKNLLVMTQTISGTGAMLTISVK